MIINNINPTILSLGPLEIRWYGLVYIFGFLLSYYFLLKNKDNVKMTKDEILDMLFYIFIGMLVGARIFHFVFSSPIVLLSNPLELFMIWHGGMSFFGGLVGIVVSTIYYTKKYGKDWWKLADYVVMPAALALGIGRIANYVNSELLGTVSNVPWCVVFERVSSLCRHPYQIYASLSHFLLLAVLYLISTRKHKKGDVFFLFVIGYSILRFLVDFFRDDPRFWYLTIWQYISIVTIIFTIGIFKYINSRHIGQRR
ncbi:prolipoprotein diacylglyceryl transferase [Candidatus Woesearchaeota archaeon]|nr:prolipoprotein diacylglyceryl transferase [Candidatus Woesearchaeota archaeon]